VSSFHAESDTKRDHANHQQNSNSEKYTIVYFEAIFRLEEVDAAGARAICMVGVAPWNARLTRGHVAERNVVVSRGSHLFLL